MPVIAISFSLCFLLLFGVVSNAQMVRVFFNFPNLVGGLEVIDYHIGFQQSTRVAFQSLGVGNDDLSGTFTAGGYVASDDVNVYTQQTFTEANGVINQQVALFNIQDCLADYFGIGNEKTTPISAIALNPNTMEIYLSLRGATGIAAGRYDGEGFRTYPFAVENANQLVLDTNRLLLYAWISSVSLYQFDLTSNATTQIMDYPITGGLSIDTNSGILYIATAAGIHNYNSSDGMFTSVYINPDFTFNGIAVDSMNNQLFFAADSASKGTSNLYVVPLPLPNGPVTGTPVALHSVLPNQFASIALAHCPSGACGQCGTVYSVGNNLPVLLSVIVAALALVFF